MMPKLWGHQFGKPQMQLPAGQQRTGMPSEGDQDHKDHRQDIEYTDTDYGRKQNRLIKPCVQQLCQFLLEPSGSMLIWNATTQTTTGTIIPTPTITRSLGKEIIPTGEST